MEPRDLARFFPSILGWNLLLFTALNTYNRALIMVSAWVLEGIRLVHRCYKTLLSPLLGGRCRFHPSCSDYALEALEQHGLVWGAALAVRRLLRCHPWCQGGSDPVPPRILPGV